MTFVLPDALDDARDRLLLCLPYAGGGSAMYRHWPTAMPDDVTVVALRLPGREHRLREPPFRAMSPLVQALWAELGPLLDGHSYALFGHSMGTAIAWQLTQTAERAGHPPFHLFVSGRRPPGAPAPHPPMFALPEATLISEIEARYGPLPPALKARPAMLRAFLPTLRADMQVIDTWRPDPTPIHVPLTAYGGVDDPTLSPEILQGWELATSASAAVYLSPGGHFHARDLPDVCAHVGRTLRQSSNSPG